jgi:hypothetical protein
VIFDKLFGFRKCLGSGPGPIATTAVKQNSGSKKEFEFAPLCIAFFTRGMKVTPRLVHEAVAPGTNAFSPAITLEVKATRNADEVGEVIGVGVAAHAHSVVEEIYLR